MNPSRRELLSTLGSASALGIGAATIGALTSGGCARFAGEVRLRTQSHAFDVPESPEQERFLNRVTFGWSPAEQKVLDELGEKEYIRRQLKADFPEPIELTLQVQHMDAIRMQSVELMELPRQRVVDQLQSAAILRAVYSPNQLKEKMIDFWSNHFNVYSGKADGAFFKGNQEEQIIRKEALGSFPEMLNGMAHSPAMLVYLDNQLNYKGHPNENFARELLELHSLGVNGGYSQTDIQEVARCFTGWSMEDRFLRPKGKFRFNPDRHDAGAKKVLGTTIPANGGVKDGELVLEILSNHPSTARYLAKKLVEFFTGSTDPKLEKVVAEQYRLHQGQISPMVEKIITSPQLQQGSARLRRPFDLMIAALRRTGAVTDGGPDLQVELKKMGQLLYDWPLPDGYPVDQVSWATNLLPRWQFAYDLAHNKIPNTRIPEEYFKGISAPELALQLAKPEFQVV